MVARNAIDENEIQGSSWIVGYSEEISVDH